MKGYGSSFRVREWRWKLAGHFDRPLPAAFSGPLRDARAVEIGGPSPAFRSDGMLPIYGVVASLDGCRFAPDTLWERGDDALYRPEGEPTGTLLIREATDLHGVADASYDAVLAAHVIEHVANPLQALGEWRRVLRPGGHLLLVVPHKEGTFDHRRPTTPVRHMVEDHERAVGEDDLTHLDEVLELHDLGRDPGIDDRVEFERRSRDNLVHRGLHHHVFTTETVLLVLDRAGYEIRAVEPRWRHDIYCLARGPAVGAVPDNDAHLGTRAAWRRASPFRADRQRVGRSQAAG